MNPVIKLALALLIGIEISFVPSIGLNLGLIIMSLVYVSIKRIHFKTLLYLFLVPIIPAIGTFITQYLYGAGINYGFVLATRIYAYVFIGADLMVATTTIQMVNALQENCRLPAKFAFGILSALNLIPQVISQVKTIKMAGEMRGVHLTWLSPTLYFKAILSAIQWADQLSSAMISHGFVENAPRTHYYQYPVHFRDWIGGIGLFIAIQLLIFI